MNEQFRRKMDENVCEKKKKLFWKEASKMNGGRVER